MSVSPRFTRGEYWLLETVVEHGEPFCDLAGRNIDEVFNKPGHGLDYDEMVDTLESLFRRGLIAAGDRIVGKGICGPFSTDLDRGEIVAALGETLDGQETYYGLTAEGGRQWEAFVRPDWNAFIEGFTRGPSDRRKSLGVLTSATLWRVQKILENIRYLGHFPNPDRVRRRVLHPWRATYWKTLPEGHRAVYRYPEIEFFDSHGTGGFEGMPHGFVHLYENRDWYRWM